jgi:hypothetical protein
MSFSILAHFADVIIGNIAVGNRLDATADTSE